MAELRYVDWDGLVYYDSKSKQYIEDKIGGCIKMGGIIPFEQLPSPSFQNLNYIYKITEEFTSNDYFEKPGYVYKAGTWVHVADLDGVYLYTIFNEEEDASPSTGDTDLSNYYTKEETESVIDAAISSIEIPTVDLSEYAKKDEIPSVDGLATETYVDNAIANIDIPSIDTTTLLTKDEANTLLATKANDVPFTDDYRVGTPLGEFAANDTLQGMTVAQILTKLLGLTLYSPTDLPEGTTEEVATIINEKQPAYVLDESGELIEATDSENFYRELTESESKVDNQEESFFYQILDDNGTVVESGYHVTTVYQENDYLTVLIPNSITNFHVEVYDAGAGDWAIPIWHLAVNDTYATIDGYTAYTVPAEFEIQSGIAIRIVIDE